MPKAWSAKTSKGSAGPKRKNSGTGKKKPTKKHAAVRTKPQSRQGSRADTQLPGSITPKPRKKSTTTPEAKASSSSHGFSLMSSLRPHGKTTSTEDTALPNSSSHSFSLMSSLRPNSHSASRSKTANSSLRRKSSASKNAADEEKGRKPSTASGGVRSQTSNKTTGSVRSQSSNKSSASNRTGGTGVEEDDDIEFDDDPEPTRRCAVLRDAWAMAKIATRTVVWQGHTGAVTQLLVTDSTFSKATFYRPAEGKASRYLFTAGEDGDIRRYDLKTAQCDMLYEGHTAEVMQMEILPAFNIKHGAKSTRRLSMAALKKRKGYKSCLMSSSADGSLRLFDINTGVCELTLDMFRDPVVCFTIYHGNVYAGSKSGPVLEVSISQKQRLRTFPGHKKQVTCVDIDAGSRMSTRRPELFTASLDCTIRCTDLGSGKIQRMYRTKGQVVKFHLSQSEITVACSNGIMSKLNRGTGNITWTLNTHQSTLSSIHLCGNFVYATGSKVVTAFDTRKSGEHARYVTHKTPISNLQITDHQFLWTSSGTRVHCAILASSTVVLQFGSYPRQFFAGSLAFMASFAQLLSIPLAYDPGLVSTFLQLSTLSFASDSSTSEPLFHVKNAIVAVSVLLVLGIVGTGCVRRNARKVTDASLRRDETKKSLFPGSERARPASGASGRAQAKQLAAERAAHEEEAKRQAGQQAKQLRSAGLIARLGWLVVWACTTVLFMPMVQVLLSPVRCADGSNGEPALEAALDLGCYSAGRWAWFLMNFGLLVAFIPVGLRLGRLEGNLHFMSTHAKSRWDWSKDHSRLRSTALIKVDFTVDAVITCAKLAAVLARTATSETSTLTAVVSFLSTILVVVLAMWRQPYARATANHVFTGLWMGLLWTSMAAFVASVSGEFPWIVYLVLLPFWLAGGVYLNVKLSKTSHVDECMAKLFSCCGSATARMKESAWQRSMQAMEMTKTYRKEYFKRGGGTTPSGLDGSTTVVNITPVPEGDEEDMPTNDGGDAGDGDGDNVADDDI